MYVNGALVHPTDPRHNASKLVGFDIPLPIVSGSEGTELQEKGLTLGFRVVNREQFSGLLVGAVVQWKDGFIGKTEEPTFYTGSDQDPNVVGTWFGERLLEEGWEQPDGLKRSDDVKWDPAMVYPERLRAKKEGPWSLDILDNSIKVYERLELPSTITNALGQPTSTSSQSQCQSSSQVKLSSGQFAGLLVGSLAAVAILASLVTWLLTRRKLSARKH
ncbi:hypothetical protein FA13DRAFT_1726363 [Coprinellus micaceus]|uniref:Uncharacterized protein n=1 Tax=Coprinellus micaceus TaxID=71717 RepID=A0A4Y7TTM8_COPMI|nr:hypothetical protein FA13DRAFT_1726363 [Coprinellus micaceus]